WSSDVCSSDLKFIPDFAPPIAGPATVNLTSIVFASESTSLTSSPLRMRVPPPAAPPRSEFITVQPSASVSGSFQWITISGFFSSYFLSNSFIKYGKLRATSHRLGRMILFFEKALDSDGKYKKLVRGLYLFYVKFMARKSFQKKIGRASCRE